MAETPGITETSDVSQQFQLPRTQRGGIKIAYEGHLFVKKKNLSGNRILYECCERQKKICYSTLVYKEKRILSSNSKHTHAPNAAKVEALKIRISCQDRAKSTVETPHQIIQHVSGHLTLETAGSLPSLSNQKRNIRATRTDNICENDGKLENIIKNKRYLANGEDFVLYNSFDHENDRDKDQMIVFGTLKSLEYLKKSEHWYADGTFDIAPTAYYQIYSLHCFHNGRVFPCIYAVFSNKKESLYLDFFTWINEVCEQKNLKTITFDFEIAAINAAKRVFADVQMHGCFFHLSQSLYRKIQSLGLQQLYANNSEFANRCKMVAAMAFVPVDQVSTVFEELKSTFSSHDNLSGLLDYFESVYIGVLASSRKPRFEHVFWNVTSRILDNLPKTNNYVEGFNNRMKHAIGCSHPSLSILIDVLKKEYMITDFLIIHADMKVDKVKSRQLEKKDRLKKMIEAYENYRPVYYLQLVASTISL